MPIQLHLLNGTVRTIPKMEGPRKRTGYLVLHGKNLQRNGQPVTPEALIAELESNPDNTIDIQEVRTDRGAVKQVELSVRTYLPARSSLTRSTLAQRITSLTEEFVALDPAPDIFLVPEYFFNWVSDAGNSTVVPSSRSELDTMVFHLKDLSRRHPETLLIPGTIIWEDDQGKIRNSAHAVQNGRLLGDGSLTRYDKTCVDYDMRFVHVENGDGGSTKGPEQNLWLGGGAPHHDFQFKDVRCRLEICADVGQAENWDNIDLQLVVASGFGAAPPPKARIGGGLFAVDLEAGSTFRQRVDRNEYTEKKEATSGTHTITLELPDPQ